MIFKFKWKQNIYGRRNEDVFTTLQHNYRALKYVGPLRRNFLAVRNLKVCKLGKTVSLEWLMPNCENMQWHNLSLDDGKVRQRQTNTTGFLEDSLVRKQMASLRILFLYPQIQVKTSFISRRYEDVFTTLQYNYRALKIVGPLRRNFLAVRNLKVCKLGKTVSSEWLMANCENMQWHNWWYVHGIAIA